MTPAKEVIMPAKAAAMNAMNIKSWRLVALALIVALPLGGAIAQEFPARNVRLITPFPPGGGTDRIARTLAPPLTRAWNQNVIIENRPGGNTVIGAEALLRAPADGHTIFLIAPSFAINPFVLKLPYDTSKDFAGVTRVTTQQLVISVHPSLPAKTLKSLVGMARARPGELAFATANAMSGQRLAMELFKESAGINLVNVPFTGGAPATFAVVGGHVPILVTNVLECAPHIAAGKLRGIAVTSLARSDVLPDVPTITESGYPGFEVVNWFGAVVRGTTPRTVVERLSADIGRALQLPEVSSLLAKEGLAAAPLSPQEFEAFLQAQMRRNERIIRSLNLKME